MLIIRHRYTSGVTLLDLLVVIAILIILVGVAIVAGNSARMRAYNTQALVCGEQIRKAQTLYYSEKQTFADTFDKLDAKMVARCALVSVVEVNASTQGYTYTVAHARGNTKYTVEDDRASSATLAGGAENAAGASDTSSGGQVVQANPPALTGTSRVLIRIQIDSNADMAKTFAATGLTYRLKHPNGHVDTGVLTTGAATPTAQSVMFDNVPSGPYTIELPLTVRADPWQYDLNTIGEQTGPIGGAASTAYVPVTSPRVAVDPARNVATFSFSTAAGNFTQVAFNEVNYADRGYPMIRVDPQDGYAGYALTDPDLAAQPYFHLLYQSYYGSAFKPVYPNGAGPATYPFPSGTQNMPEAPNQLTTYGLNDATNTYYRNVSGSWSVPPGQKFAFAGRRKQVFVLNTTPDNAVIYPSTTFKIPGNITTTVKVPMASTDRAVTIRLNFPEPLPANTTADRPFSMTMVAGTNFTQVLTSNVTPAAWDAGSTAFVDLTRTNSGATLLATATPVADTASGTATQLPGTITSADTLTRYVLDPTGLTLAPGADPANPTFAWAFTRTQTSDTVLNATYVKQTRTCTSCTWTP